MGKFSGEMTVPPSLQMTFDNIKTFLAVLMGMVFIMASNQWRSGMLAPHPKVHKMAAYKTK